MALGHPWNNGLALGHICVRTVPLYPCSVGTLIVILGFFWLLVGNGASLLGAHAILRRIRTGQGPADAVLFLLIRLTLISASVIAAGLTMTLTSTGLGVLGAIALIGLVAFGAHRKLPRFSLPNMHPVLLVFGGIILLRLLLQAWFFAPHLGDSLNYYLPKVAEWIRAGGFTREMGSHPYVTYPGGFELIEVWWVVFIHHDVLIEMAGIEFLILACTSTYALARRLQLPEKWASFAGILYVMTPGLHLSATSCLNDSPTAALVVTTATLILARIPLQLLMIPLGLGLGIKPTYGFALPGMVILWYLSRKDPKSSPGGCRTTYISIASIALLAGAFWYLRNIVWFNNPFYPLGESISFGISSPQFGPSASTFLANLADLIDNRIYDSHAQGALVDNSTGWGATCYGIGLVALLVTCRIDGRIRRLALCFLVSLLGVLLLVIHDPYSLKYVFFFPAILSVAIVRLLDRYPNYLGLTVISLGFSFASTILPYDLPAQDFLVLARQSWHQRSAAALNWGPADTDRLGCLHSNTARPYVLYKSDFSCQVIYFNASSGAQLVDELRYAKVQLLYARASTKWEQRVLREAIEAGNLRNVREHFYQLK